MLKIDGKNEVKLKKSLIKVEPKGSTPIFGNSAKVTASPRSYHIVSPDVYTIKRNNQPDQWFRDMLENSISTSKLANDVGDLNTRFENFENGVTMSLGDIQNQFSKQTYYNQTLKQSLDNANAAIQHLDSVKVTADEARNISQTTLGSWMASGESAAWFDSKVSTVSNIAMSAAKSASNLTASIKSQHEQLLNIVGDMNNLKKQVDGKVETWFGSHDVVDVNGNLITSAKPFVDWKNPDIHTGDTYVKTEVDPNTGKDKIIGTWQFVKDANNNTFKWELRTDDLASKALQQAIDAQHTADGKVTTYYQDTPPVIGNNDDGDIWIDSSDNDKMYMAVKGSWTEVSDKRIEASVKRLDEATVDVNGKAVAKSSLSVDSNGVIAGYVAASNGQTSSFDIYANKFSVSDGRTTLAPLRIENGNVYFNGVVEFSNIANGNDIATLWGLATPQSTTVIDGSNIKTGSIDADRLSVNKAWIGGFVQSTDFNAFTKGFRLKSEAAGTYSDPTIYGAYIRGGTINGANMIASTLSFKDLIILSDKGLKTKSYFKGAITMSSGNGTSCPAIPSNGIGPRYLDGWFKMETDIYGVNQSVDKGPDMKIATDAHSSLQIFGTSMPSDTQFVQLVSWKYIPYDKNYSDITVTIEVNNVRRSITYNPVSHVLTPIYTTVNNIRFKMQDGKVGMHIFSDTFPVIGDGDKLRVKISYRVNYHTCIRGGFSKPSYGNSKQTIVVRNI